MPNDKIPVTKWNPDGTTQSACFEEKVGSYASEKEALAAARADRDANPEGQQMYSVGTYNYRRHKIPEGDSCRDRDSRSLWDKLFG